MEAILSSLLTPVQNDDESRRNFDPKVQDDERRILLEIMQISRLEEEKKKGNLTLGHLKRKNKTKMDEITPTPVLKNSTVAPAMFQKKVGGL
jgi:hypothetical protein